MGIEGKAPGGFEVVTPLRGTSSDFPEGTRVRHQTNNDEPGDVCIVLDPLKEKVPSWRDEGMVYVRRLHDNQKVWYEAWTLTIEDQQNQGPYRSAQEEREAFHGKTWHHSPFVRTISGKVGAEERGVRINDISHYQAFKEDGVPGLSVQTQNGQWLTLYNISADELLSYIEMEANK